MKAILLAGGLGTRIRPFSFTIPKPLLPVGEKPILEIILKHLKEQGVKEVVLAVGYRSDLIRAYVSQLKNVGFKISFVEEKKRLGTAGPLLLARNLVRRSDSFFVMNSDILTRLPFRKLWAFHNKSNADVTVAVRNYKYRLPYGVLKNEDKSIWLKSIAEKPSLSFTISTGVYCFRRSALKWIPPHRYFDIPELLQKILKNGGRIATYHFTAPWKALEQVRDFSGVHPADWK